MWRMKETVVSMVTEALGAVTSKLGKVAQADPRKLPELW